MSRKYYKKSTAIYKFKLNILPDEAYKDYDDDQKKKLWLVYLYELEIDKKITSHQAMTWKYPTKELN